MLKAPAIPVLTCNCAKACGTRVETLPAIPIKYKMLMYVTAAAALGSDYCTKIYARRAVREGATTEEIMEAVLIARFVSASTVFATAIPTMEMLLNLTQKGGDVK